jgi:hypothetical protein
MTKAQKENKQILKLIRWWKARYQTPKTPVKRKKSK